MLTCYMCITGAWAAWYNTWLLMNLIPEGGFLFLSFVSVLSLAACSDTVLELDTPLDQAACVI